MSNLAFLGLGQMGAPMAGRLLGAGHELTVWNRTRAKAEALRQRGARVADSPREAARGAEVVFTMLATPEALQETFFGRDGLHEGLEPGAACIEMSTVGPEAMRTLARRLPAGVTLIDAPVLGSVPQATDGTLQVFVGASRVDFERWGELLGTFGTPVHVGPRGAGASMKLVANSTLGTLMTALGEALALADALQLDLGKTLDVLAESPIGVTVRSKREHIENGTYPPRFKLALARKDMRLVTDTATHAGAALRLAAAARTWFEEAADQDLGKLDYSAVIAHIRGRAARLSERSS